MSDTQTWPQGESTLRKALGIPDDAERVIILSESQHWDPDWLMTAQEYYDRFVKANLGLALDAVRDEERRVYSIECMYFLRMYWEDCPERQDEVRGLINRGRLRLTSSGVTTADTLLPAVEAILRDWLLGQEWLRAQGIEEEPRLAYFADSFGCTPCLPSLLNAAGFDRTAITRVDGMSGPGADYEPASHFPRPGSTAERLLREVGTLDFVWRDANGAEALCHWNAFGYGQGDMISHRGISRVYIVPFAVEDRSERHVARRIGQYVAQLDPYRRTPYMFCPIGYDFVPPIRGLVDLLDRYNRIRYPTTGVWTVNAALDDYLDLIDCYRSELPTVELDPNPYWTGFYSARPTLKQQCHRLVDSLLQAERLAVLSVGNTDASEINQELWGAWWDAATANHHDFITGTSPDRVVYEEQIPWLERAQESADRAVARLTPADDVPRVPESGATVAAKPEWHRDGNVLVVRTPHYVVELDEERGGTIARAWYPDSQRGLLGPGSSDLVLYRESGGPYRMGHEFAGGAFKEMVRASDHPANLEVHEHADGIEVQSTADMGGERFDRALWFSASSPVIRVCVRGRAPDGHTVAAWYDPDIETDTLTMDAPGGVIRRPTRRIYDPTYWPLYHWAYVADRGGDRGFALWQALPGAAAYLGDGAIEVVAARNATRERVFGFVPLLANPATAHERTAYALDYAILFTEGGDWLQSGIPRTFGNAPFAPWQASGGFAAPIVEVSDPEVTVIATKPASRGTGLIVRLYALAPPAQPLQVSLAGRGVEAAWLCDARERDIRPLPVREGVVLVEMSSTIVTVRLLP